jgi:hypothetical protein
MHAPYGPRSFSNRDRRHLRRVRRVTLRIAVTGSKMRGVDRAGTRRWLPIVVALVASWAPALALAQTGPGAGSPGPGPTVSGEVAGDIVEGSTLTLSVDATMPGGWEGLHLIGITARSGDEELQHIRFDVEDNQLRVGELPIAIGTGAVAESEYLRISGSDVVVTTGGANLSFSVEAAVVTGFPEDITFQVSATTDDDVTVTAQAERTEAEGGGITWGTVAAVVVVALLAGGLIGNLSASRRRPPPKVSVYGSIQRRIDDERRSAPERR